MKFVALALALLLAVGSQAASLQADAPSQLEHIRAAVDVYLTQVKEGINRALAQLDDTEYKPLKDGLSSRMDDLHAQIKTLQGAISPMTDSFVSTVSDATKELRTSLMADIDTLRTQAEADFQKLKPVLESHLADYRTALEPLFAEYSARHTAEALWTRVEPIATELRNKFITNVEETKDAMVPMVDTVRAKITERLENLREVVDPYVTEYRDQLTAGIKQAQSINFDDLNALPAKITPLAEDIKAKLDAIFAAVAETFNKN